MHKILSSPSHPDGSGVARAQGPLQSEEKFQSGAGRGGRGADRTKGTVLARERRNASGGSGVACVSPL